MDRTLVSVNILLVAYGHCKLPVSQVTMFFGGGKTLKQKEKIREFKAKGTGLSHLCGVVISLISELSFLEEEGDSRLRIRYNSQILES